MVGIQGVRIAFGEVLSQQFLGVVARRLGCVRLRFTLTICSLTAMDCIGIDVARRLHCGWLFWDVSTR